MLAAVAGELKFISNPDCHILVWHITNEKTYDPDCHDVIEHVIVYNVIKYWQNVQFDQFT